MELSQTLLAAGEAMLIGFLIGAQREASRGETEQQPGVRDFTLIALTGAFCGIIDRDWIIVAALAAVAALLAVYHQRTAGRTGITTELAAVVTFFLGYLTSTARIENGTLAAVALTILVIFVLAAKSTLHELVRKTISEREFYDTIRFLALVFVIYPVLPADPIGPYQFFDARKVWLFVILVCSISYFGYFLHKFAGEAAEAKLSGVLGGLASSTAATAAFARLSKASADETPVRAGAAALANAIQFPRVLLILYFFDAQVALACLWTLLAMTAAGIVLAFLYWRGNAIAVHHQPLIRNPLSITTGLRFGLLLTLILFVSKVGLAWFGTGSVHWLGAITGLADVDAILLPVTELHRQESITTAAATVAVLLALGANAVTKTVIAAVGGTRAFAVRVAVTFLCMFGVGAAVLAASSF